MASLRQAIEVERDASWARREAWWRQGCAAAVGLLLAAGALLVLRRAAGALTTGLPPLALLATVGCVALVVLGGRVVWRGGTLSRARREQWESLYDWGGTAAIVLFAVGCSWGQWQDWLLWLSLLAVDRWQVGAWGERDAKTATSGRFMEKTATAGRGFMECELQRLVRVREADGEEAVRGTLRAEFAAGQRSATLHVGFCPPLERTPFVEAEPGDGPPAEVKVSQAFSHGARLEVRLAAPAEEACCVLVEVSARPQAAETQAAMDEGMGRG